MQTLIFTNSMSIISHVTAHNHTSFLIYYSLLFENNFFSFITKNRYFEPFLPHFDYASRGNTFFSGGRHNKGKRCEREVKLSVKCKQKGARWTNGGETGVNDEQW